MPVFQNSLDATIYRTARCFFLNSQMLCVLPYSGYCNMLGDNALWLYTAANDQYVFVHAMLGEPQTV